jgi:hypothetical protein
MNPDTQHSFLIVPYDFNNTIIFFFNFRAPPAFICYRRGRDRPPLIDLGVLYEGQAGFAIKKTIQKNPKKPPKTPNKNVLFWGFFKFLNF